LPARRVSATIRAVKFSAWLALACVTSILVSGCNQRAAKNEPITITFARGADSQKLDPADVDDGESMKVLVNVTQGLVRFKHGTTEPEPCLATSWTISPDGLAYTFKLRDGVKFHDGTPLDAKVAAFSFLRQMDKSNPAHLPDATFAYWSAMFNMITAVEVVDPMTLRFRLKEPHAPLMESLCIPAAHLISPKFIDQRHPVGTGPFRFVEWLPNERITLEKNPDYWEGAPQIDRLIFTVVPDSSTRLIQLQTGQCQVMDGIDPNSLPIIKADKNLSILTAPGLNVCYLAFNCQKPPFDGRWLRQWIASSINKEDIIKDAYRGAATVAKNPMPPLIAGYNDAIPESVMAPPPTRMPRFDHPLRLEVMTNPRPYLPNPLRAAEMIKADLERAHIPVEIVPNEWGSHLSRTSHGEHEMALMGWVGDTGDADNFLYVLLDKDTATLGSALNICFWMNDDYHNLMIAARRELDLEKRAALYRKAQEIVFEECPMVPLAHAQQLLATRANVNGVLFEVNGDILFQSARVK